MKTAAEQVLKQSIQNNYAGATPNLSPARRILPGEDMVFLENQRRLQEAPILRPICQPVAAPLPKPPAPRHCRRPGEFKLTWLSPSLFPGLHIETPAQVDQYWRANIPRAAWFDPDKECSVVIILNRRRKIIGHNLVSIGLVDMCLIHAREVFRPAIAAGGCTIILTHNHPSGESTPSHADLAGTREIVLAGAVVGIELADHIIIGEKYFSIRHSGLCNFNPDPKNLARQSAPYYTWAAAEGPDQPIAKPVQPRSKPATRGGTVQPTPSKTKAKPKDLDTQVRDIRRAPVVALKHA